MGISDLGTRMLSAEVGVFCTSTCLKAKTCRIEYVVRSPVRMTADPRIMAIRSRVLMLGKRGKRAEGSAAADFEIACFSKFA